MITIDSKLFTGCINVRLFWSSQNISYHRKMIICCDNALHCYLE
jgi:hypothetical protein